jgi:hypothetical protein
MADSRLEINEQSEKPSLVTLHGDRLRDRATCSKEHFLQQQALNEQHIISNVQHPGGLKTLRCRNGWAAKAVPEKCEAEASLSVGAGFAKAKASASP